MRRAEHWCGIALALVAGAAAARGAQWSLADHLDRVLVHDGKYHREYTGTRDGWTGPSGGMLRKVVVLKKGTPAPFTPGLAVGGKWIDGQLLLCGPGPLNPTIAEFAVDGGTSIEIRSALADGAVAKGNSGTRLEIQIIGGEQTARETISITDARWQTRKLALPGPPRVLVRLLAFRRGHESTNWSCVAVCGDGTIGPHDHARALSPDRERIGRELPALAPSPHRVEARAGYDILFHRGRPWFSHAVKGYPQGSHPQQIAVGVNTYYNEGLGFAPFWKKDSATVELERDSAIHDQLRLCQEHGLPFKCPVSMAHCSPFLPPWLVEREGLNIEGHQLRRGGAHHTSIFKAGTLLWHKRGLDGWVKPFLEQPALFVLGQEEDASLCDDHSPEAEAAWRAWLRRRFDDRWDAFVEYIGGARGCGGFDQVPQLARYDPDDRFGYPMRLGYLKLLWVTDVYTQYMGALASHLRRIAPGVPLTQRYVNWPNGVHTSRRVRFDYNYSFGHLSIEGLPNSYGIGRKPWSGIHAHMGTLPLPRGGSIGLAHSREIRRGEMNERQWRANAYTLLANGCCGTEYSTLTPGWGPAWDRSALMDRDMRLTPTGDAGQRVMREVIALAPRLLHYEHAPDVAVFHDASFNSTRFGGRWSQSKVGIYTLIRETGFHPDPLTEWDMNAANLRGRKVLVLAGTLSIAPEIQDAIRQYVREGGALVAVFCADAQGLPGANGYDYSCPPRESAAVRSFDKPASVAHLGDVLGVRECGGLAPRASVRLGDPDDARTIALGSYAAIVAEKRWVDRHPCAARLVPRAGARVIGTFDDGTPAAIENEFGKGRAFTAALDLGLVSNNITLPPLYAWWSRLLTSLGCRRVVDTNNPFVEAGLWRDDTGGYTLILVNHDDIRPQTARLPDGTTIELRPGEAGARTIARGK